MLSPYSRCAQRGPSDWANQEDRWLHEVVLRIEGPAGLGEIARATCRLHDLRAWCEALAVQQQRGEDLPERLERAWRASPSLLRLQRWLGSSETSSGCVNGRHRLWPSVLASPATACPAAPARGRSRGRFWR